jgi:predicted nucleic acid-binding protein
MLIDPDVLVWLMRGHVGAAQRLKKGLAAHQTEIVPITPAISQRAAELIVALALSHGMRLADALIGATAIELQATLITANVKHFSSIEGLSLEPFLP